ncbi:MAG: DUF6998 domain-containing protein [Caulobacteraceae bacterium]
MHDDIGAALKLIFEGIEQLKGCCLDGRRFTIDGRLVGDIGELVAAREFDIVLDRCSRPLYDATTREGGRNVQIKATFLDTPGFGKEPELFLGLKLSPDGTHEVVFNGPGKVIGEAFAHRKGIGEKLLSLPVDRLRELGSQVAEEDRIKTRA